MAAGFAQPAFAAEREVLVEFESYELSHPAGRKQVEARIVRAAKQVCQLNGVRGLAARVESDECFEATYAEAMDKLQIAVADASGNTSLRLAAYEAETVTRNG